VLVRGQLFADRYRVEARLGSGGMGDVYEAVDTRTDSLVALKVLRAMAADDAKARERFELEAKVRGWLQSEHIVRMLDTGFSDGVAYLVMERLRGMTLSERLRRQGRFSPEAAIPLLRQVARALGAAHGHRDAEGRPTPIVHRDLKPENIFLADVEGGGTLVKILDFGIATVLGPSRRASHTQVGTAEFMAYEYLSTGLSSAAMDIWALGLIAYQVLTGHSYWRSARDVDVSSTLVIKEILDGAFESPKKRLEELGVDLGFPPAFDAWLLRCLERDPRLRPATASEAIDELERAFTARCSSLLRCWRNANA
jgi:serine/threonine protein kinase